MEEDTELSGAQPILTDTYVENWEVKKLAFVTYLWCARHKVLCIINSPAAMLWGSHEAQGRQLLVLGEKMLEGGAHFAKGLEGHPARVI